WARWCWEKKKLIRGRVKNCEHARRRQICSCERVPHQVIAPLQRMLENCEHARYYCVGMLFGVGGILILLSHELTTLTHLGVVRAKELAENKQASLWTQYPIHQLLPHHDLCAFFI